MITADLAKFENRTLDDAVSEWTLWSCKAPPEEQILPDVPNLEMLQMAPESSQMPSVDESRSGLVETVMQPLEQGLKGVYGGGEAAVGMGRMLPGAIGGMVGAVNDILVGKSVDEAKQRMADFMNVEVGDIKPFVYNPETEEGKQLFEGLTSALEVAGIPSEKVGEFITDITGSPEVGFLSEIVLDPLNILGGIAALRYGKKPALDTPEDLAPLQIDEATGQQVDVPVVQTQRPLEKASEQFKAGLISGEEAVAVMDDVVRQREMASSARAWNQAQKGRARGARFVRSKIDDAVRKGEIDPDAADVALWALNKNPSIADDLGISITKRAEGSMVAGAYSSSGRIVKLFKGEGNPTTAIHEILHHSEKMLPPSLRNPIADLWKKRLTAAVTEARKAGDLERADLLLKQAAVRRGEVIDNALQEEIIQAYKNGNGYTKLYEDIVKQGKSKIEAKATAEAQFPGPKLIKDRDYQFTNPSEFWAENAAEIIAGKYGKQGKWVDQAKDYINELVEHIKNKIGLDSNDALYKGIKQVLSGQQLQKGSMIAESEKGMEAVLQFLNDPTMLGTIPDLIKTQESILRGAK